MKNYLHQLISKQEFQSFQNILENTKSTIRNYLNNDTQEKKYFDNKVVIVTGASSGIGKAISFEFAKQGAIVVMASRDINKLNNIREQINNIGGNAISISTDVTDDKQCKDLIKKTVELFGKIDILVNNAGISMRANFIDVDLSVLKKLMDTNFWGTVYCTKYALPHIIKTKGSIIGISSICGITPLPGRTGYAASKHALDGFLETVRVENIDNELHVLVVHPGFTSSNIRNVALNKNGLPQEETPRDEAKLMSAESVAKEVLNGIMYKKREITLTTEGKLITWLYKRAPNVAEKFIYNEMKKEIGSPF